MPPAFGRPAGKWAALGYPKVRLRTIAAELAQSCDAQSLPRSKADILRDLRSVPHWHVLGTRRTKTGFSVRLARSPDASTGSGPFIRHRWRIVRAVVEVWRYYDRTEDGRYVLAGRGDAGLLEGNTPGRFLLAELKRLLRFEVVPRLGHLLAWARSRR
jgi:hypothetical protein